MRPAAPPRSDKTVRTLGLLLWTLGILAGGALLVAFFMMEIFSARDPGSQFVSMLLGAVFAVVACFFYIWVPVIIDRYDPEPWWCLALAFLWGAIPACGFSAWINTFNGAIASAIGGRDLAEIVGRVVSAPLVEEAFKGMAILGMFWFLRREFDGIVDGVIYGTFAALGFAMTENILYYGRAGAKGGIEGMTALFFMRGVLAPWGHPLYTAMTGIGVGIARETNKTWLKLLAPIGGYCFAAILHAIWNGTAVLVGGLGGVGVVIFVIMLLCWLVFLFAFGVIMVLLVRREGNIIRKHLQDEVLMGNLTREELELVCSPWGRLKTLFGKGGMKGRRFIDAASRLALSKWHAGRAMQGKKMTISADFVVPLRQELHKLRHEIQTGR